MESLYEQAESSDSHEERTDLSTASYSSHSPDAYARPHRDQRSHHNNRHDHHHHRAQRYVEQQPEDSRVNSEDDYLSSAQRHEASSNAPRPPQRTSTLSDGVSSHAGDAGAAHGHADDGVDDDGVDDDGYFLSAVSGLPSLEVEDLMQAHRVSEDAASLVEDFPVPTWSQGSRLLERRIQQAVDQETLELEAADLLDSESGVHGAHNAYWATGSSSRGVRHAHTLSSGVSRWQPGPPPLAPASSLPPPPSQSNSAAAASTSSLITAASQTMPPSASVQPRMREAELLADPRNRLLDLVITNTAASVTLSEVEQTMQWSSRYEPMYGPLLEYLQSYQSIFVVSPVDDRVRLRRLFSIRTTAALRERRGVTAALASSITRQQPQQQHPRQQQQQRLSRARRSRRSGREASAAVPRTSSSAAERRSHKPSLPSAEALAAHIGSVSYSCVGEHLHLDRLEMVYRRRGYDTAMMHTVLHVTNENDFHLFLFSSGAVVWWGMDRKDHWMVEDDFLAADTHLADGVEHRYVQSEIEALFPIWCSYEVDEQCDDMQVASPLGIQPAAVKPALERLSKVLCFDHYLVPATEPACSLVMLTFSHSLGCSARVDYFEYVTKWSHRHILSIPAEFSGLLDYFSTKRRIAKLEGEIEVAQLAIQSIQDTPEVLWEVPWLQAYYDMVEQQNTSQSRLTWFASRSDTLLEQLSHIKARRHRLFMLGSDVFLIVILILDVMFMTSRLVAKMYFKVEEED